MDTSNQRKASVHSNDFHEECLSLFDAYATDELNKDERLHVERNVQECQECQRLLADIIHFRQGLQALSETDSSVVAAQARLYSQPLLQTVMASLEQEERQKKEARERVQTRISFPLRNMYNRALSDRTWRKSIYLSLSAAFCCLIVLAGLITMSRISLPRGKGTNTMPTPLAWRNQQLLIQNSAGVFAIKGTEIISGKEFRFYYAFKSSHHGTIHASAFSTPGAGQSSVSLHTTVLPVGTIDHVSVGIIRVQYMNHVGQTITLNITSPQEGKLSWQISPLKQQFPETNPERSRTSLIVDQQLFPDVILSGQISPALGSPIRISLFRNPTGTQHLFIKEYYDTGKFEVITREQCIQLIGEQLCSR